MATDGRRVSVGTTATRLDAVDTDNVAGQSLIIKNGGAAAVDVGSSTVTSGAGFEVAAGDSVTVELGAGDDLYGIAASGTVSVHVLETGV